jgi:hypothetical protein
VEITAGPSPSSVQIISDEMILNKVPYTQKQVRKFPGEWNGIISL